MAVSPYREERLALPQEFTRGKIGVVTVLYNSSAVLGDFFASIEQQRYPNFVVYCVDNASTDDSVLQCRSRDSRYVVLENGKNLGVAAGNNVGIREAVAEGCEYILLLNNDVVFGPDLFAGLVEGLSNFGCSMTTPLIYYHDRPDIIWAAGGKFQPAFGYRCLHLGEGEVDHGQFGAARRVEHAPTCCVLLHRAIFQRVGLMDERYFVYHDDTDFMLRCHLADVQLMLLPNLRLLHKVSSLTGGSESEFSVRMGTRNRIFMIAKFLGKLIALPYGCGLGGMYLIRYVTGRDSSAKFLVKAKSLWAGYRIASNWFPCWFS
jgi:GT2 family glycosyltransferase